MWSRVHGGVRKYYISRYRAAGSLLGLQIVAEYIERRMGGRKMVGMENAGVGESIWGRIIRESQGPAKHKIQVLLSSFPVSSQREVTASNIIFKPVST